MAYDKNRNSTSRTPNTAYEQLPRLIRKVAKLVNKKFTSKLVEDDIDKLTPMQRLIFLQDMMKWLLENKEVLKTEEHKHKENEVIIGFIDSLNEKED